MFHLKRQLLLIALFLALRLFFVKQDVEACFSLGNAPKDCNAWDAWRTEDSCQLQPEALQNKLREAAKDGDIDQVRDLVTLKQKPDFNWRKEDDETCSGSVCVYNATALIHATFSNRATVRQVVRRLLDNNETDVNAKESWRGYTALMLAAYYGRTELVRLLLDRGANINEKDNDGSTALMLAAGNNNVITSLILLNRGAETAGCTPQFSAICELNTKCKGVPFVENGELVETLPNLHWPISISEVKFTCSLGTLLRGPNVLRCIDGKWQTSGHCDKNLAKKDIEALQVDLRQAAKTGNVDQVRQLLHLGLLDVDWRLNEGHQDACCWPFVKFGTALHHATRQNPSNLYDIARALVSNGADVNLKERSEGWTALIFAAHHGQLETVRLLLDGGAWINLASDNGDTALMRAAYNGHLETIRLLIGRSARINGALVIAASNNQFDTVRLLLDRGVNIDENDRDGWTPLMKASENGHSKIVRLLLDRGADVNAKNRDNGRSALMLAAGNGRTEIVRLLLRRGANINEKDSLGFTALTRASVLGHLDVVRLLRDEKAIA